MVRGQPNIGLVMAVVNEYDMVPRADGPYLRSVVELYRSRYALPPLAGGYVEKPSIASLAVHASVGLKGHWALPPPTYYLVGDVVVLKTCLETSQQADDSVSEATTLAIPLLKAVKVSAVDFSKLLFCDVAVHRRMVYLERLEMLATGGSCGRSFMSDSDTAYTATESSLAEVPEKEVTENGINYS
jgi:hypothetical protein